MDSKMPVVCATKNPPPVNFFDQIETQVQKIEASFESRYSSRQIVDSHLTEYDVKLEKPQFSTNVDVEK